MLVMPFPRAPSYVVSTEIDGILYDIEYTYDEHRNLWRFSVRRDDVVVLGSMAMFPMVAHPVIPFRSELTGSFVCVPMAPVDYSYDAFVDGDYAIVYAEGDDLSVLMGMRDVIFYEDEGSDIVPVIIRYPLNNAILGSGQVVMSGTGPANSEITVSGHTVQVDEDGEWLWAHTFDSGEHFVVAEGRDGQRATVRFVVMSKPLTIDPVGIPDNGTRYVYTEVVEVTGAYVPNTTITVNGQSVLVDGDGDWSTTLTLASGGLRTVTAQASDGQSAQVSVYVWGEADVEDMLPEVWADSKHEDTVFVDSQKTRLSTEDDPIGRWSSKGTAGDVGDFVQEVSADRMIYRDGMVETDANNQSLVSQYSPPAASVTIVSCIYTPDVGSGWSQVHGTRGSTNINTAPNQSLFARMSSNSMNAATKGVAANQDKIELSMRTVNTGNLRCVATSLHNGVLRHTVWGFGSIESSDGIPADSPTQLGFSLRSGRILRRGCIYVFERQLTEQELTHLFRYMEARHGID